MSLSLLTMAASAAHRDFVWFTEGEHHASPRV